MRFIGFPTGHTAPQVAGFRRRFSIPAPLQFCVEVSADERYELFLDGVLLGRGPTRGDAKNWFYETYALEAPTGEHELFARVSHLGKLAPAAQMGVAPGFALRACAGALDLSWLDTENPGWETKILSEWEFEAGERGRFPWFTGPNFVLRPAAEKENGWEAALLIPVERFTVGDMTRILEPSPLPPQKGLNAPVRGLGKVCCVDDRIGERQFGATPSTGATALFQRLGRGESIEIEPNTRFRALFDLQDYVCAYPQLRFEGGRGARISIEWAEALEQLGEDGKTSKLRRDAFENLHFLGPQGDTVWPDGRALVFSPGWWRCGRFLKLEIESRSAPLRVSLELQETGYPLEISGEFSCNHADFEAIFPPAIRALEMCSHETFVDCPYYEQLQYVGDTRLQALVTLVLSRDDRLIRHALRLFDSSRDSSGLTRSRYPCAVAQTIPPFSLWWVWMLHDFAFWRGDEGLQRELLPGARAIAESFLRGVDERGLLHAPPGWNFLDWVSGWRDGVPQAKQQGGGGEVTSALQWHLVGTLNRLAQIESEPEMAARWQRHAHQLATAAEVHFWDAGRGAFRDAMESEGFAEHPQALAVISGHLSAPKQTILAQTLSENRGLNRASIYFSHYVFEALRVLGRADAIWPRLDGWFSLRALDLKTTPETFSNPRSDCHAWGAHPVFHAHATFAGVRPLDIGFQTIEVSPQFGPLTRIQSVTPHPRGEISLNLRRDGTALTGQIAIPSGTELVLNWTGNNAVESIEKTF